MFCAAMVAERANEGDVTAARILAALIRTESMRSFCAANQVAFDELREVLDESSTAPFDECAAAATRALAEAGVEFFSKEHRERVELRPLEPSARRVVDRVIERHGAIAISPLALSYELLEGEPALAVLLSPFDLRARMLASLREEAAGG